MKHIFLFALPLTFAVMMTTASVFADEPVQIEAEGKNLRVTLKDRAKFGERQPTALEAGTAGQVHVEYLNMPDERWQEVRWIVRFPIKEWEGRRAKAASLTTLLYTILGERNHRLKIECIEGGQGEEISRDDRVMAASDSVELELPEQLPADIVADVTGMLNASLEAGHSYIALRFSVTSERDYPGDEAAGRLYFAGENNPEGWVRGELPSLNVIW